jgi:hypothetical protein
MENNQVRIKREKCEDIILRAIDRILQVFWTMNQNSDWDAPWTRGRTRLVTRPRTIGRHLSCGGRWIAGYHRIPPKI